jgi:hypothetical protein
MANFSQIFPVYTLALWSLGVPKVSTSKCEPEYFLRFTQPFKKSEKKVSLSNDGMAIHVRDLRNTHQVKDSRGTISNI